jgi:hypothetical protein
MSGHLSDVVLICRCILYFCSDSADLYFFLVLYTLYCLSFCLDFQNKRVHNASTYISLKYYVRVSDRRYASNHTNEYKLRFNRPKFSVVRLIQLKLRQSKKCRLITNLFPSSVKRDLANNFSSVHCNSRNFSNVTIVFMNQTQH